MAWKLRCITINWWDLPLITSFQTPQSWPFLESSAETVQWYKCPGRQDTPRVWPMAPLLYPWGPPLNPTIWPLRFGFNSWVWGLSWGSHFTLKVRWEEKRTLSVGFSLWKYCRSCSSQKHPFTMRFHRKTRHPTFSTKNNVFWKSIWFVLCEGTKETEYLALRSPEPCGMH